MTLKLEVGKKYRNGYGEIDEILESNISCINPYLGRIGVRYTENGVAAGLHLKMSLMQSAIYYQYQYL